MLRIETIYAYDTPGGGVRRRNSNVFVAGSAHNTGDQPSEATSWGSTFWNAHNNAHIDNLPVRVIEHLD
jgi:hypothetical protein